MAYPVLLIIPFRGFKYDADIQLMMEDLCFRYNAVDKEASAQKLESPFLSLFNFCPNYANPYFCPHSTLSR